MKRTAVFLPILAMLATIMLAAPASAAITVPSGETIHTVLTSPDINSKNAAIGQEFTMAVVAPYPMGNAGFAGATVYGHVSNARKAGQGRKAILSLGFDRMTLSNGQTGPLHADATSVAWTQENTVARKALGAGAGMAVGSQTIGRIIGGTAGGVIGTLGGAAGGYAYANNDKPNISLVKGHAATLTTTGTSLVKLR